MNVNLLGIHLRLRLGTTTAEPATPFIAEALRKVTVTTSDSDKERSGFQLTFHVGRVAAFDILDFRLLKNPLLQPFSRVGLTVTFNATVYPLMDGIITSVQLTPSAEPGASTLTVTGEDVSVMMDLEEAAKQFPGQNHASIVRDILKNYKNYFTVLDVGTSLKSVPEIKKDDSPDPKKKTPTKPTNMTDLGYIKDLAKKNGFAFYVEPLKAPNTNRAYWGPPERIAAPQKALNVNLGPQTNVESINFSYKALAAQKVAVMLKDGKEQVVESYPPLRGLLARKTAEMKVKKFYERPEGQEDKEALAEAQAQVSRALDEVVTVKGSLNALSYGAPLRPRTLVDLRGAGLSYDGTYYVKQVTHTLSKGEYKQEFTLTREGTGALLPFVRP